ncbi:LEM3 CDC50 family [Fusarium albosuccineum]|uniref:LEM3 CDC50 family n=1 Tax=Fusarium albosuccineum TaxID=1237068 RepID=A0A8H4L7L3_9HYPO|nr:LEM3 CDC50 family [Fusarium albosuccineum]
MTKPWGKKKIPNSEGTVTKSRKPKDNPFNQQRMQAWELIRFDYTRCHEIEAYDELKAIPSANIYSHLPGNPSAQWKRSNESLTFDGVTKNYTQCTIEFSLDQDLQPPVLFYYRLTKFYQNHRKYMTSLNSAQLKGHNVSLASVKNSGCSHLASTIPNDGGPERAIYPCGLIANSYFNDSFASPLRLSESSRPTSYNMSKLGIASNDDKSLYRPSTYRIGAKPGAASVTIVPPPNWAERYPRGYHSGNMFDPEADESFMVWMRTAAAPNFAKLAMRNLEQPMESGRYRLQVFSHFPAHSYGGTKSIILASSKQISPTESTLLGVSYMACGGISIAFVIFSVLVMFLKHRSLKDHHFLHRQ